MEPTDIALAFNRYASTVKDKEFLAHVSTWINQRRFEDETNNKVDITNVIGRLKKLGYTHKEVREKMSTEELYAWNAYFEIKSEREEEAYEKAKRQAQVRKVR